MGTSVLEEQVDTPVDDEYVSGNVDDVVESLVSSYQNSFNKGSWHSLEETHTLLKKRTEERMGL
jgi:hypothetical protein